MKKLKLKISQRSVFRYVYGIFFVLNLALAAYLYGFLNKNVRSAIIVDQAMIEERAQQSMEDVDIDKFDRIIKAIDAKTRR